MKDRLMLLGTALAIVSMFSCTYLIVYSLTRTAEVDDCMIEYVKQLNAGTHSSAYVYDLGDGYTHIDTEVLPLPVIGKAYGCLNLQPGKHLDSIGNTAYCYVAKKIH